MKPRWRVVLVDDHALSKASVALAMASVGGVIVGTGASSEEALALVERYRPDVVILAVGLADGDGVDAAVARFREFEAIRKENEDLKKAIESRKLVERAKGLLMEREGLSESQAFRRIQKASMDSRRPMVEVAEAILLAHGHGRNAKGVLPNA